MFKISIGVLASLFIVAVSSTLFLADAPADSEVLLKGYDPVSYFNADEPKIGNSEYAVEYDGKTLYFASAANRDTFTGNPDKFMPAYEGHCSYGVSLGQKFDIDPLAYRVVDGRLFLQLDQGTRTIWMEDENANIKLADKNWPHLRIDPEQDG